MVWGSIFDAKMRLVITESSLNAEEWNNLRFCTGGSLIVGTTEQTFSKTSSRKWELKRMGQWC